MIVIFDCQRGAGERLHTVRQALDQLSIYLNATNENWASKLEDYIDKAGHYSYAREIKEILEDEEADA